MYSGTTFRDKSGRLMGVHQKIDRVARKHIVGLLPKEINFPGSRAILHFEGKNGPDGIKRKSPSIDEPWHFIDPTNPIGSPLAVVIAEHIENLAAALADSNMERSAFEASWLAHAITDGLTPAHHYPLEEKLRELRKGEGNETRSSILKKGLMKGETKVEALKNNWKFWGAKGAMTTHLAFEAGIASVVAYQRFNTAMPTEGDITRIRQEGFMQVFYESLSRVAELGMYDKFHRAGWTTALARQTNTILMPTIIRSVTLAWLDAAYRAEEQLRGTS